MARRLILDTGVLIAAERSGAGTPPIDEDDDVSIAAVTLAELRTGVHLAGQRQRADREAFVAAVQRVVAVEVYDEAVAEAHAGLLAHVHRNGRPRRAHDLIVAATAVATGRLLVSADHRARFDDLPGVRCLDTP